jgi:hypothetical protein
LGLAVPASRFNAEIQPTNPNCIAQVPSAKREANISVSLMAERGKIAAFVPLWVEP